MSHQSDQAVARRALDEALAQLRFAYNALEHDAGGALRGVQALDLRAAQRALGRVYDRLGPRTPVVATRGAEEERPG